MTGQPHSWDDLNAKPAPPPADDTFAILCAQVFTMPSGKALLAELRKRHFEGQISPLADERALRVRITQQQFVRELELACERGIAAAAKRKQT